MTGPQTINKSSACWLENQFRLAKDFKQVGFREQITRYRILLRCEGQHLTEEFKKIVKNNGVREFFETSWKLEYHY
ncbi:MAG: hypothetical protein ACFFD4_34485 [Candidatus Odinarchaeota archaeon]